MKIRPSLPWRRDLGLQLLALYLLFVGLVIAATLTFEVQASRRLANDVQAANLALARAIAQETNTVIDGAMQAVRQLAAYPAVRAADSAGMLPLFGTVMSARSDVNLIYRLDAAGTMLFHYPVGPESTVGVDFSFRDYYVRALGTRDPLVSLGRISPTTGQPVATAVMPLWSDDGVFQGLVATNLKLQTLSHSVANIVRPYPPEERLQIMIVDAAGKVIAHADPNQLLADATETMPGAVRAVLTPQTGNVIAADESGEEALLSYAPIPSAGWGVIVSRPTAVAFATRSAFRQGAWLALGIFLAGGGIFWLALSRRVIRPLERLTAFSQTVGLEDGGATPGDLAGLSERPDQVGHLSRSMVRMQQAIDARLNELSTLLQTSSAVVSTLNASVVLDRILAQVERLLDAPMCAILALDESRDAFRVQASRGLDGWYAERTAIDPNDPNSLTMRAIRSGQPVQISDTESSPGYAAYRPRARAAGYRSLLAVPLLAQHTAPAALLVYRPDPHVFTDREISLLANFANHAAMAIENATLYARSDMRLREQTLRLEALIQSLQDGLILEDLAGRVLYANRRIAELSGAGLDEVVGQNVDRVLDQMLASAPDRVVAEEAIAGALARQADRRAEFALALPEGLRYLRLKAFDVTDAQGAPIGRGRILQDITQRHEVDRMRASLISTVSHELRTPLAAIKGYATTLLAEDVQWDRQSQEEFLRIISEEADHLSDLVNDLLDMSRIDAGSLTVSRTSCALPDLIRQAALRAHPRPGARLQISLPPDLPPLYADARRITVVLRNLLENAAKYSGDDSPIRVWADADADRLTILVEDEGPGIPLEHGEQIFGSFYRIDNGLTRRTTGAGLGLAIARGFVRAHGGEIWLEQRARGACVAFSLPLVPADAPPVPA